LIEGGCFPIGRTGAEARAAIREAPSMRKGMVGSGWSRRHLPPRSPVARPARLTLTPALLTDLRGRRKHRGTVSTPDPRNVEALCCASIPADASPAAIANRRRPYGATYYPFVLTSRVQFS
jgi:hypothetical protein